jgi:1-acyl-sn-glycerol-3-phosphate acyltransferase
MSDRLSDAWYDLNFSLIFAAYHLGWSYRSDGFRNVPKQGPLLIVANHQSFLDPLLVGLAVRLRLTYLARKTLFKNPIFGGFLRSVRCIPVDQEGVAKDGLIAVLDALKRGEPVLIFPEGERTPDGRMQPLRPGVHLLIKRGHCPVLPVGIAGGFDSWPRTAKLPTLSPLCLPATKGTVAAVVGQPIPPERFDKLSRQAVLDLLFHEIETLQDRAEKLRRKP